MSHTLIDAQHYQKNSSFQEKCASEVLLQHQFAPTDIVLDIGCGDGKITAEIARHVENGRILGIDSSKEMIALAKKTFIDKFPNLNFQQTDAESYHGTEAYTVLWAPPTPVATFNDFVTLYANVDGLPIITTGLPSCTSYPHQHAIPATPRVDVRYFRYSSVHPAAFPF